MEDIGKLVPPRVLAVAIRTACNGWLTARRFQAHGTCVLGCGGDDSVEHYAGCAEFLRLRQRFLGLPPPGVARRLAVFLGLDAEDGDAALGTRNERAALNAVGVYALSRTHNAVRHGSERAEAAELFRGFLQRAVENHAKASSLLACAGKRRR